jgi:hypothetical protein
VVEPLKTSLEDELDEESLLEEEQEAPRRTPSPRGGRSKGFSMSSLFAKLKKVKPVYLVLGATGIVLAADYYFEREQSVTMKLYREIFGGTPIGSLRSGRSFAPASSLPLQGVTLPFDGASMYPPQFGDNVYYPSMAPPMYAPHYRMRHLETLHAQGGRGPRGRGHR